MDIEHEYNKMNYPDHIAQKFWDNIIIPSDWKENKDKCWIWKTSMNKKAYYHFNRYNRFDKILIHRFSYEYFNGEIPFGLFVLHKCDNPPCVNPFHLFLGTQEDNMKDRIKKGRINKGNKYISSISDDEIKNLIDGILNGRFLFRQDILEHFQITETILSNILNKRCRINVTCKYSDEELFRVKKLIDSRCKLNKDEVQDIRERLNKNESFASIARDYNVGVKLIKSIFIKKTYYEI